MLNLQEKTLGIWESRSKSSEINRNPLGTCKCHFFAMEVKEELDSWPEQAYHERRWVSIETTGTALALSISLSFYLTVPFVPFSCL